MVLTQNLAQVCLHDICGDKYLAPSYTINVKLTAKANISILQDVRGSKFLFKVRQWQNLQFQKNLNIYHREESRYLLWREQLIGGLSFTIMLDLDFV